MARIRKLNLNSDGPTIRICKTCGRRIPLSQHDDLCRDCLKREIFPKVKEYINENPDVNEMIVATQFDLDRDLVHEWIREGRLQYRNNQNRL